MAYSEHEHLEILERLIDETSLSTVLQHLSLVCGYKEDHMLSNWQDKYGARDWRKAVNAVSRCAHGVDVKNVS